ncbi:MAG TPA: hypothetical protein VGQ36_27850 [Thermoanaerobaculia bacterium]|jgi:hypothetical protein|nr:hypothetical protein [Thermoanaerobaculia bacterium]
MKCRFLLALLLSAGTAAAQEVATAVVPVVGSVFGPTMIHWRTDVEIVNDTGLPTDIALELPCAPDQPVMLLSLGAGQSQRFTDIIGQAFGLEQILSPLRVTTSGRRSVSVRASAYAMRDDGSFFSTPQPLGVYVGPSFHPTRLLDGLAFSEKFRTNIGLVNFGTRDADFVLALQRIPGRTIAVSQMRVHAGGIVHTSIQSVFPLITEGSGFSVIVETASPETHVYASVIESATHSGRFVAPRIGVR